MRKTVLAAVVTAVLAMPAAPALGVNGTVSAGGGSNVFTPPSVTVALGESVTWNNAGGTHNVSFDDGSFTDPAGPSSSGWTVQRTFSGSGTFAYHCQLHGGMTGTVVVGSGTTTSTPEVGIPSGGMTPAQTTPAVTTTTTASSTQAPPTTSAPIPKLENATLSTARLCRKKSGRRRCVLQGANLSFKLTAVATLVGELRRKPLSGKGKYKLFGTVKISAKAGKQTVKIKRTAERKKLTKGRYQLLIKAVDSVGTASAPTKLTVKLS